jgi:uncharacterized protein
MFLLLRPVGLNCQASCGYCYYKSGHPQLTTHADSKMSIDLIDIIFDGFKKLPDKFHTICLHGGEPLLIGKEWTSQLVEKVKKFSHENNGIRLSLAIQTNGMTIDEEWIEIFKEGCFGVSVSIDGPESIHNAIRIDKKGNGTFKKVFNNIKKLQASDLFPSAISVISKESLKVSPENYYSFFQENRINEIDVALYIEAGTSEKESIAKNNYEANAEDLLQFIYKLFDLWLYNKDESNLVNIRMFEQSVSAILGYTPTICNLQEGLACGRTPCIMPDGTVFACDLETDDVNLVLGNVLKDNFENILSPEKLDSFHSYIKNGFSERGCYTCDVFGLCAFACPRYTLSKRDFSSYCNFTKKYLEFVKTRLNNVSISLSGKEINYPILN